MNRRMRLSLLIVFSLCCVIPHAGVRADEDAAKNSDERVEINKIYFLFHPCCWQAYGETAPPDADAKLWASCFNWEVKSNAAQKKLIDGLKADEVLVVFPVGNGPAMQEIIEHGEKTLGRRCIVVRREGRDPPASWKTLSNPFERFLNDPDLEGRDEFLKGVPDEIQDELANEIRQALKTTKGKWNISVLDVIYYSRLSAMDINHEFKTRKLHYDPETVRSVAFGEGFEQCAMTWKQMLVPYMGLKHPAENLFELSVSGAPFLIHAELKERIELGDDLRLFLWENDDGQKIAMYARAWCRLKDPQYYVSVPLEGLSLEVREVHDKECWPNADGKELELQVENGRLRVPVFNGIRRDFDWRATVKTDEEACYLIAENISLAEFRQRLIEAEVGR